MQSCTYIKTLCLITRSNCEQYLKTDIINISPSSFNQESEAHPHDICDVNLSSCTTLVCCNQNNVNFNLQLIVDMIYLVMNTIIQHNQTAAICCFTAGDLI